MELRPAGSRADPSFCPFSPAVLCLHHDLPVHPPRFQHLLPVSTAEAASASLVQNEAFPERVCSSWLRQRCASTSTKLSEMRVLFHFIEGRIFVHWCHVVVVGGGWGVFHIRVCGLHEGRPHVGSKPAPQALTLLSPGKKPGSAQGEQPLPVPCAALWGLPLPQPWAPAPPGQPLPSCGTLCNSHPECPEPALQATKSSKRKAKGLGSLFIFGHFSPALLRCWTSGAALALKLLLFTLRHRPTGSCHPALPLPAEQGGSRCSSRHLVGFWKQRKSHFLSSCRLKGHRQGATCGK